MSSDAEIDLGKMHDTIMEELNNCNEVIEEYAPEQDRNKLFKIAEESFLTTLKAKKEWELHKEEIKKLEEIINKLDDEDNLLDLENSDKEDSHTRTHTTNSQGQKDNQFLTIMEAINNINGKCVIEVSRVLLFNILLY
uniref:Uncharacterized protein n=1 Tax=Clastoptera arizonana TaxID=38151 RepID=A0A1B6C8A0_9HEMI